MEDSKELICEKCNKKFNVGRDKNNKWIRRRFCPDCSDYGKTEKYINCKICGKQIKINRKPDGKHWDYQNYTCSVCKNKQKQQILNETKTLICQKCNKEFQVSRSKISGNFLLRKYCFDCDLANKPYRLAKCATCGKEFKQYRTSCGGFSEIKYCSYDCSLIQKKTKRCVICNKEFELERSKITGNFKNNGKYCSDECAKIGWFNLTKKTCQKRYGVDLPCQSPKCTEANPTNKSKISDEFYVFLINNGFSVEREFVFGPSTYDYHILDTNILVELNPTFTHTCYNTGVYPPKLKTAHYNKSRYAKDHNYICVCVWAWTDWNDVVNLLKQNKLQMIKTEIELYYTKNKTRVKSDNPNDENLIKSNYLPVYTDGYEVKAIVE